MNNQSIQNDLKIFADNAVPFNSIKLISTGNDGCVKKHIVDISAQTVSKEAQLSAQSTKSVTIVKQQSRISSIATSNDTHTLFIANGKAIITQFQKEDSSLNYYPVRTFKGHTDRISSISLSNSKMHLLSAGWDKTLIVWDLEYGNQLACLNVERKEHQSKIFSCCWNDQDTLFSSGDVSGSVVVWSLPLSIYNSSNHCIAICEFKGGIDNSKMCCLKFQENGLDLITSYTNIHSSVIRLWSINEKELLDSKSTHWHQQNATLPLIQQPKRESWKSNGWIYSFDVRGSMLIVVERDKLLQLSTDSLQSMVDAVKFEKVHNKYIMSLAFSKDGQYYLFTQIIYVASGNFDKSVAIFDSKSGKCVKHIKNAHSDWRVRAIVFEI